MINNPPPTHQRSACADLYVKDHASSYTYLAAMRRAPALCLAIAVLSAGCKKEKDGIPPAVEILEPEQNSSIAIPAILNVKVRVSDDQGLHSLSMQLLNASNIPIAPPVVVELSGTSAVIERALHITDERIRTGVYTLEVRASDGENDRRAFRSVNVTEAPLRLRSVFVSPPFGTAPAGVVRMDSVGSITTWTTVSELCGSEVDSRTQHLILAGCTSAPLVALPTASGNTWQAPSQNALPQAYFTSLSVDPYDGRLYVCSNDGSIRGYTGDGAQVFTAHTPPDRQPYAVAVMGPTIAVENRALALPQASVSTYTASSGSPLMQWPLDVVVTAMFRMDEQHLLVIGERAGLGVIQEHRTDLGVGNDLQVISSGAPRSAVRITADAVVIAVPGRILRYTPGTNTLVDLAQVEANTVAFDPADGHLLAGAGDQLLRIDPSTGMVLSSTAMPIVVGDILPLLNR